MTRNNRNCKLPRAVFFLDGFKIRHGVAFKRAGCVYLVRTENGVLSVFEDDFFSDFSSAQRAANSLLN